MFFSEYASLADATFCWEDIDWLKSITKLPLIFKGILHPEDAVKAIGVGAKAIIVSNHGGRQLDGTPSSIECLKWIKEELSKLGFENFPLLVDGGINSGLDIFKAIALGADAILIGRPILWSLSYDGEEGVKEVLQLLKYQLQNVMQLCGCKKVSHITKKYIFQSNTK